MTTIALALTLCAFIGGDMPTQCQDKWHDKPPATYNPYAGWASYYDQRPTDMTLAWRVKHGYLDGADLLWAETYIAVSDCWRVGERGYIQIEGVGLRTYVVFDCTETYATKRWLEDNRIVAELDYYTRLLTCECGVYVELYPLGSRGAAAMEIKP